MDRIEFDSEELTVAEQWHGGQSSMLYAIASTGALKRGTHRPDPDMTDAEWLASLASKLESEADRRADDARALAKRAPRRSSERTGFLRDASALESIGNACREAIAMLTGGA